MGVKQNETSKARASILLTAAWVDAGRLSERHRRELFFDHLPKKLQDERATAFLHEVSERLWSCEIERANEKPSVVRDAGMQVNEAARQLQTAIAGLTGNDDVLRIFDGQFTGHLHATDRDKFGKDWNDPRVPWDEKTGDAFLQKLVSDLDLLRIDLDLLRTVANLLSENANVDPNVKPSKAHAYNIAYDTAIAWRKHFSKEPTANTTKEKTPFLKFMAALVTRASENKPTKHLYPAGFVIGASIANRAIQASKNLSFASTITAGTDKK